MGDLDGSSRKYQWVRRLYRPFVTQYIALSRDLERYLLHEGRRAARTRSRRSTTASTLRASGRPRQDESRSKAARSAIPGLWLVGTVGRHGPGQGSAQSRSRVHPGVAARAIEAGADASRARGRRRAVQRGARRSSTAGRNGGSRMVARRAQRRPGRSARSRLLRACRRSPKGSRTPFSRRWRPDCRSSPPTSAATASWSKRGTPARSCRPLIRTRSRRRCSPTRGTRRPARAAGRAGRARIERDFSLESMLGRYQALYDRLLGEKSSTRRVSEA